MRIRLALLLCVISLLMLSSSCLGAESDRITKDAAVEDVQQFFSTLQRAHPDLLAKVSLEDYLKLKQQTRDGIEVKLDGEGRISVPDIAYLLYYAAASFGDAHTSVNWRQPSQLDNSGKKFPPFLLRYDNGRFIINGSNDKSMAGLEVTSVAGKPVTEFLSPILDRISGETLAWKVDCFTDAQGFWYSFSNVFRSEKPVAIGLRDRQGHESERKVEMITLADFEGLSRQLTELDDLRDKGTQIHFLDSDRIAWFIYPEFKLSKGEKEKIDSIFEEIEAKGCRDLIIDIRDNGGGSSGMGDYILGFLHDGKLAQTSKTRLKVSSDILSPEYTDLLSKYVGADAAQKYSAYLRGKYGDVEGMIVTLHGNEDDEQLNGIVGGTAKGEPDSGPKNFFRGRVFLLANNGSFSSASMFAAAFRDYGIGTILGYETGGVPVSFGELYVFYLKNSGIPCGCSWKQSFNAKPRPGDDEHGILPDIPMTSELLRPYQDEDDPVLAFTLDHIKKTRR